jgi:hypothetical protein
VVSDTTHVSPEVTVFEADSCALAMRKCINAIALQAAMASHLFFAMIIGFPLRNN